MADENGETELTGETAAIVLPSRSRGVVWEALGCLVPLVVAFAFILLTLWGYRLVFGSSGPHVIEAGQVQTLELISGDGKEHIGRSCRVYAEWLAIQGEGGVVLIPRERVQSLRLTPTR